MCPREGQEYFKFFLWPRLSYLTLGILAENPLTSKGRMKKEWGGWEGRRIKGGTVGRERRR